MASKLRAALVLVLLVSLPPAAAAGSLRMAFAHGYVTISATDVPLRQVLSEWARLGNTRIVNIEKLAGGPLTLELAQVPEKQALETILRGVPGYLVALRAATLPGTSQFDRIVVMPGTVTPPTRAAAPPPPPPPIQPPQMPPMAEDEDEPVREQQPDPAEQEPAQQPEQQQQPRLMPQPGFQPVTPNPNPQGQTDQEEPQQPPGPVSVPSQGVVVSPTPGQLPLPPPQKPQPQDQEQDQ